MAASRRASPPNTPLTPRRGVAIKRADGEPLTRVDIQYDFLHGVFNDSHEVFSDPYMASGSQGGKLCFRDLYLKAILNSPKATKALKDKMTESSVFAEDFAMLSLLVNVGRLNTTMSFFPEMKTAIRTYHPIASLQRTNGNMQDAPRIKHILKTSLLEDESKTPPATPAEILARCKVGQPPSTSITNLVFVLAHHSGPIGQTHFQRRVDFVDLFLRREFSSASRSQAFLWLCYNYLESPSEEDDYDESRTNPFADPAKTSSPPPLVSLTYTQSSQENQESPEDIMMTEKLIAQRNRIVQTHGAKETGKASAKVSVNGSVAGDDESVSAVVEEAKGKGKHSAPAAAPKAKGKPRPVKEKMTVTIKEKPKERELVSIIPDLDDEDNIIDAFLIQRSTSRPKLHAHDRFEDSLNIFSSRIGSHKNGLTSDHYGTSHRHRYSPYTRNHSQSATAGKDIQSHHRPHSVNNSQPRNILQQAWQVITSTDPLVDSDEEMDGDEYAREDYVQRLKVINRFSRHHWAHEQPPYSAEMEADPF